MGNGQNSSRSIQGKRASNAMNLPPSIQKKKSVLAEMIDSAVLEVDQPMYGDNSPKQDIEKFQGQRYQMKSDSQNNNNIHRKSSYRGTRLHKKKNSVITDNDTVDGSGVHTTSVTVAQKSKSRFTPKDPEFTPEDEWQEHDMM